jgi:hypothetical protein
MMEHIRTSHGGRINEREGQGRIKAVVSCTGRATVFWRCSGIVEEQADRSAIQRCEKSRSDWKKIGRQNGEIGLFAAKILLNLYTGGVDISYPHPLCIV